MEESVKKEIMKQAQKILNKRLKDYHILTKDNININITNGIKNYSAIIGENGKIEYIMSLEN